MKWLKFAFSNLFRNKRRTFVTLIVVATGTASIICSSGFALYTYSSLRNYASNDSGHLILAHKDYFDQEEDTPLELGLTSDRYDKIREQFKDDSRVKIVLPKVSFSGLVSNGDKTIIFIADGIDPREQVTKRGTLSLLEGGWLRRVPKPEDPLEVILAVDLAKKLKTGVGEGITLLSTTSDGVLNALDVQVRGIVSTGVPEYDERMLWVHISTAQDLLASNKVSSVAIFLHETNMTDVIKPEVVKSFPDNAIHTWLDEAFFYVKVRNLYDRIFGTLGLILVLIIFLAVFNTLSMTVVERTREIGTLSAIGTYKFEILRIFMLEASLIGIFSSVIGVIFSFIMATFIPLANIQMPPPPGRSDPYPFVIQFSGEVAFYAVVAITIACVIASFLAARRGVNKTIVEALADV